MISERICPVCGKYEFSVANDYEECPVCGWVDDLVQRMEPDYKGGFNRKSLNEYRMMYQKNNKKTV